MSTLSVDTIQGKTTAGNVKLPNGCIVQTQSNKSSTAYTNTTTSFSDITGATLTFTPKFATSILRITFNCHANVYTTGTNTNAGGVIKLVHDGTDLDYNSSGNYAMYYQNDAADGVGPNNFFRHVLVAEVTASNTNARVIKAQGRIYQSPTAALRINTSGVFTSYFFVEEIAQ